LENVSHTVVGLAAGEFIQRSISPEVDPKANALRRKLFLASCAIASNFPDLDLIYSNILPSPLGYLLHHRGHTHTILYEIPQALLLVGLIWCFWPSARRLLKASPQARKGFAISIVLGFALHLAMDFLNSYGIHPFHPFDSNWFFGDMIFIVEPLFWVTFATPLLVMVNRVKIRNLLALVLAGFQMALVAVGVIPVSSLLVLTVIAVSLGWLQSRSGVRGRTALVAAFATALVFVGVQFYASGLAKRLVKTGLSIRDPSALVLDVAASASPTNPLCWGFVSVEKHKSEDTYRITRGRLSLAEDWQPVANCSKVTSDEVGETSQILSGMVITGDDTGDLGLLRRLANENCNLRAWMRFSRIPVVTASYAIDRRFSVRGEGGNFSYLNLEDFGAEKCSGPIPDWNFPRADLLGDIESPASN
jgi:inner membrane protein